MKDFVNSAKYLLTEKKIGNFHEKAKIVSDEIKFRENA